MTTEKADESLVAGPATIRQPPFVDSYEVTLYAVKTLYAVGEVNVTPLTVIVLVPMFRGDA